MMNLIQNTTAFALAIAKEYLEPGALVIDATCGNGHDTLALAEAMWPDKQSAVSGNETPASPQLLAIDIRQTAIEHTRTRLIEAGFLPQIDRGEIELVLDSHEALFERMAGCDRSSETGACLIMFNLGYLPGGDKGITTEVGSTMSAVRSALQLLAVGGLLCITMYSGHEAGKKEKQALLAFAEELDSRSFHVSYISMINQQNDPPEILLISRKR